MSNNINLKRYHNAIRLSNLSETSFFNKWYFNNYKKFMKRHEKEYDAAREIIFNAYEKYERGEISLEKYSEMRERNEPINARPVSKFFIMLPEYILTWLCCGWKKYDRKSKSWVVNDSVHMTSKLNRYETWDNVKITWWDKIRFFLITGHRFEKNGRYD